MGPKQGYVSSLSSDTRQSSTQSHNPTRRLLNPRQEISHFATLSLIMNKRAQGRGLFKLQQSIIYGVLNADGVSRYASANTCQRSSERCWHTTRTSGMNDVVSRTLCPHVSCMGVFLKKKKRIVSMAVSCAIAGWCPRLYTEPMQSCSHISKLGAVGIPVRHLHPNTQHFK